MHGFAQVLGVVTELRLKLLPDKRELLPGGADFIRQLVLVKRNPGILDKVARYAAAY